MSTKLFILDIPAPKTRKPVQRKPNTVMKSKRDYNRKKKHRKKDGSAESK